MTSVWKSSGRLVAAATSVLTGPGLVLMSSASRRVMY